MSDEEQETMEWYGVPRCPYCHNFCDNWRDGLGFVGDERSVTCDKCDKDYIAIMCVDISFQSRKEESCQK